MKNSKTFIKIKEDNHQFQAAVSLDSTYIKIDELSVQIKIDKVSCGTEVTLTLLAEKDFNPEYIEMFFDFNNSFCKGKILAFNNSTCTNDPAFIVDTTTDDSADIISRDIVLFKSEAGFFNLAMTSANRFYTDFVSNKNGVTLRYFMEGKTLKANEKYVLEQFVVNEELDGGKFFDLYAIYMAEKYNVKLPQRIDCGWSSWSCFYKTVTQNRVLKQSELLAQEFLSYGADLVQIDDGWQNGATFCADWTNHPDRFPDGIESLSSRLKSFGLRIGFWYAPTIFQNDSEFFKEHKDFNIFYENNEIKYALPGRCDCEAPETNGATYPLDLENDDVVKHICDSFARAVNEYDCKYFKIDFIIRSLLRCMENQRVTYNKGYNVEVYQNMMKKIRETVGDDSYMLACGAPITEAIGIFDSIRTSPDITWEAEVPNHPGFFKIITMDAQNVFLRSYYHGRVFINDPDALVVRGKIGDVDDNFAATLSEAKVWATVVAMSGGTILINEKIDELDIDRIDIIKNIMHPTGLSLVPEDFFEFPLCTKVSVYHNNKRIAAVFNWNDDAEDKHIKNNEKVFAFDCWNKNFAGVFEGNIEFKNMDSHSVNAFLLVKIPDVAKNCLTAPVFLCDDSNFHMGIQVKTVFNADVCGEYDKCINIDGLCKLPLDSNIYIYVPNKIDVLGVIEIVYTDVNGKIVKMPKKEKLFFRDI